MTTQPTQDAIVTQRADGESDDRMTATARKNLRTFVSSATFKCRADQSAALSCIDVLEERIDGLYDLITVLRDAIGAFPSHAEIEAATIERCVNHAKCAFDDRPNSRSGHHSEMDWTDGYRDGTRAAESAIRNLKGQTS
ncbi:MAG: hypothetical protein CL858_29585 [Cupriavidus sp.]|uniref:hypothetical protein n=1 Tax=Sphingobium sp. TaxID=1912891 RepID=UPI000C532D97|nr:hypothetical protein [Sphingobium sp.]MBU69532.1 hypothetical protein [Cupriavidus sp.]